MGETAQGGRMFPAHIGLARSVFLNQLVLAGATMLHVTIVCVIEPGMLAEPVLFFGMVLTFLGTGMAAAVPRRRLPKFSIAALPVIDNFGVCLMRDAEPMLDASLLPIFPVIWLSSHFHLIGAIDGIALCTALGLIRAVLRDDWIQTEGRLQIAVVFIALIFVAATTYSTTRRARAQNRLLIQQAQFLESAHQRSRRQEQALGGC